ncbi:MAG TPA: outer membrane protein assembly factor BamC [Candidatus Hydrogenedens sp.]|nr:outer membrane protein assembly factor BamC [Candidatus Hydrogenedens sp.]
MLRKYTLFIVFFAMVASAILLNGCAGAIKDTSGFAEEKVITVKAPFEKTWQATKETLRELKLDIYTRDKRGAFVAYDKPKREWMQLNRVKYEINLGQVNSEETKIYISAVRQVYGVTLLTNPDWHDRKIKGTTKSEEIITKIAEKVGSAAQASVPVCSCHQTAKNK